MRAVVRRVDDDGVVGDAQLVELVEHHADVFVVLDHPIVVVALPRSCRGVFVGDVGAEVHGGRVEPEEERLVGLVRLVDEAERVSVISSSIVSMRFFVRGPVSVDLLLADPHRG